jgi:ribosomal protein L37E
LRAHLEEHADPAGKVPVVTRRRGQSPPGPETAAAAAAFLDTQEITVTDCRRCGVQLSGINGRYSCSACGWVNHWSEGHNQLPPGDADDVA